MNSKVVGVFISVALAAAAGGGEEIRPGVFRTPADRFQDLPGFAFEPHYQEIEGYRVHYLDEGPRDGEAILLIHGEPTWAYLFRKTIPVLAAAVLERAWLPEAVAGALAGQLGERMGLLEDIFGGVEPDPARLSKVARNLVESMADVVEGWGAADVIKRAPDLRELGIGPHGNRHLDAMGRNQMCNAVLMLQLQNPAYQQDTNARVSAVLGLSAVTMAVLYLREPFMAGGGDPADIEAYLAGPTFEPLVQAMQSDDGTLERAEAACEPIVIELLREPISELGPPPESP